MQRFLGLVQGRAVGGSGVLERFEGEQDAALGVDGDVGGGRRGEPAGGRRVARAMSLLRLPDRDRPNRDRRGEEEREGAEQRHETPVVPRVATCAGLEGASFGRGLLRGGVEKFLLDSRQLAVGLLAPLERGLQPGTAVQLGVRSAERVPPVGGADEMPKHPLPGDVLFEPRTQPRPSPGECFVGDLERLVLGGEQTRADHQADHVLASGLAEERSAGDPIAHRVAVGRRADEAQQHRAQAGTLAGRQTVVEPVGGSGDRSPNAAAVAVTGDGQRLSVPPAPRFGKRMRQQRQAARLPLAVADQQVDEPVLEPEPGQERRLFDRLTQGLSCQRGEEVKTMLGEAAQLGVDAEPAELVAAHGDDDRRRFEGVSGERLAERADRLDGQSVGEELLELIDHQHRRRRRGPRSTGPSPRRGPDRV